MAAISCDRLRLDLDLHFFRVFLSGVVGLGRSRHGMPRYHHEGWRGKALQSSAQLDQTDDKEAAMQSATGASAR